VPKAVTSGEHTFMGRSKGSRESCWHGLKHSHAEQPMIRSFGGDARELMCEQR
jgi:hypothetical protein